jgi:hypothetical protein
MLARFLFCIKESFQFKLMEKQKRHYNQAKALENLHCSTRPPAQLRLKPTKHLFCGLSIGAHLEKRWARLLKKTIMKLENSYRKLHFLDI